MIYRAATDTWLHGNYDEATIYRRDHVTSARIDLVINEHLHAHAQSSRRHSGRHAWDRPSGMKITAAFYTRFNSTALDNER